MKAQAPIVAASPIAAVPNPHDNFNAAIQLQQATRNLAASMIVNAQTWVGYASAQSPDLPTLAGYLVSAAASYLSIITRAQAWVQANSVQASAAMAVYGASPQDFANYVAVLQTAATALQKADVSSYAACAAAANAVIAAVPMPAVVFP